MEQNLQFKWGEKAGDRNNRGSQFYLSFTMEGVEYFLYDSVYLYHAGSLETYIGKLVSIFETETHEKKVRVLWFFRPAEICNFLGDYKPHWNELFLGSGEGKGLSNINPLEAIAGKCNVVCTSKDDRNRQPSKEELRTANYFFCRTFDVGKCEILENFPDEIRGLTGQSNIGC
ncbi:protein ANTI-SILENCING 1-like [Pyrus communis]|uniref:protein ANTI-SILENCING 1-like n=1 Tax=Pyrus communis TaxID=23211 RepID=UPI0035C1E4D0